MLSPEQKTALRTMIATTKATSDQMEYWGNSDEVAIQALTDYKASRVAELNTTIDSINRAKAEAEAELAIWGAV